MNMAMWIMSDRTIPRSFRFMEGFGVHTFRLVNAEGKSTFVKFHWKPKQGLQSVVWNEAVKINGADPDFHRRDLWDAIQTGDYPEWELGLQLFDDDFADRFAFDILDATKIIPEEEVPVRIVGRMVLDRVRRQFLRRDRAGRLPDRQRRARHRLHQRPAAAGPQLLLSRHAAEAARQAQLHASAGQRAALPVPSFPAGRPHGLPQPQGPGQLRAQFLGRADGGPREAPETGFTAFPPRRRGRKVRERGESFADHYSQARQFFVSQTEVEQAHISRAFAFELQQGARRRRSARASSRT